MNAIPFNSGPLAISILENHITLQKCFLRKVQNHDVTYPVVVWSCMDFFFVGQSAFIPTLSFCRSGNIIWDFQHDITAMIHLI